MARTDLVTDANIAGDITGVPADANCAGLFHFLVHASTIHGRKHAVPTLWEPEATRRMSVKAHLSLS